MAARKESAGPERRKKAKPRPKAPSPPRIVEGELPKR